jgi:hypothetical protein
VPEDWHLGEHIFPVEEEVRLHRAAELCRPRQLEEENRRLKQLVAGLALDKVLLQEVLRMRIN